METKSECIENFVLSSLDYGIKNPNLYLANLKSTSLALVFEFKNKAKKSVAIMKLHFLTNQKQINFYSIINFLVLEEVPSDTVIKYTPLFNEDTSNAPLDTSF